MKNNLTNQNTESEELEGLFAGLLKEEASKGTFVLRLSLTRDAPMRCPTINHVCRLSVFPG